MARHEHGALGHYKEADVFWSTNEPRYQFRIQDDHNNEVNLTQKQAADLAIFLVRWLFEYVDDPEQQP